MWRLASYAGEAQGGCRVSCAKEGLFDNPEISADALALSAADSSNIINLHTTAHSAGATHYHHVPHVPYPLSVLCSSAALLFRRPRCGLSGAMATGRLVYENAVWATEEDKVFENALAQFWEHNDRLEKCTSLLSRKDLPAVQRRYQQLEVGACQPPTDNTNACTLALLLP